MTLVAFDTLKYVSRLERSGFERKQATELAEVQSEILSELMQERLATKIDLHEVKTELRGEIHEFRAELQGQIQEVRHELLGTKENLQGQIHQLSLQMKEMQNTLLRWTGGLITGSVVILSFLLKALKLLA